MKIMYGVCVGSWERFGRNVAPRAEAWPIVALSGQTSIAAAYDQIMMAARAHDATTLILQHDDLEIVDPDAEAKIIEAIDGGADLVGVAGGGSDGGIAWWNQAPIGHQRTDVRDISFGIRTGDVQCLEGSLIAMSTWALWNLRFDRRYPGFHGYDADTSRQAIFKERRVAVVDVETWHHTPMGFRTATSEQDWAEADRIFRAKWGLS